MQLKTSSFSLLQVAVFFNKSLAFCDLLHATNLGHISEHVGVESKVVLRDIEVALQQEIADQRA